MSARRASGKAQQEDLRRHPAACSSPAVVLSEAAVLGGAATDCSRDSPRCGACRVRAGKDSPRCGARRDDTGSVCCTPLGSPRAGPKDAPTSDASRTLMPYVPAASVMRRGQHRSGDRPARRMQRFVQGQPKLFLEHTAWVYAVMISPQRLPQRLCHRPPSRTGSRRPPARARARQSLTSSGGLICDAPAQSWPMSCAS